MAITERKSPMAFRRSILTLCAMLALGVTPTRARAAVCSNNINGCCMITSPGDYLIQNGFTASATGTCIDIVASDVALSGILNSGNPPIVTGPGTAASTGIVIEPTARRTIVSDLELNNFGLGMAIDGPHTVVLEVLTDFDGRGKVINAPRAYLNFGDAGNNTDFGIKATANATHLTIVQTFARNNGGAGFHLRNLGGAHLNGDLADSNGSFGFWFDGTSNSSLVSFEANDNGTAGVYLGCNPSGPSGVACPPWRTPSDHNFISGVWVVSSGSASETDSAASASSPSTGSGVAIDVGCVANLVTFVTANNYTDDMLDENPNCASNIWQSNTFTTSSPAKGTTSFCIN